MTALITSIMIMLGFVHSSAPSPQQATAAPAPAAATTTTFHSDPLKLDYVYPSSFQKMDQVADQAIAKAKDEKSGGAKEAIDCVTAPLTAMNIAKGFEMIFLMRMDETCLGEETPPEALSAVTESALKESLARFGTPTLGTSTDYDITAGHAASTLSGSVLADKVIPGQTFYAAATCSKANKNVVCWEFLAADCTQLAALSANTVKFEGQPAQAVIPAKLTPACK